MLASLLTLDIYRIGFNSFNQQKLHYMFWASRLKQDKSTKFTFRKSLISILRDFKLQMAGIETRMTKLYKVRGIMKNSGQGAFNVTI